jgi:hypothetical protein
LIYFGGTCGEAGRALDGGVYGVIEPGLLASVDAAGADCVVGAVALFRVFALTRKSCSAC